MTENLQMEFLRSAKILSVLTLLSRILGLIRDMIIAAVLYPVSDALYLAWTLPNLFRKLFGEGALSSAFIPIFIRVLNRSGAGSAFLLARRVITCISLCLLCLVAFLVALTYILPTEWLLPLFGNSLEKMERTLPLARILLPYLLIVCVIAQCQGVLNSLQRFFVPALSPIILNITWIIAALLAGYAVMGDHSKKALLIAAGIMVGGIFQLILFGGALKRERFPLKPSFTFKDADFKEVIVTMVPMALGVSAVQINVLVDRGVVSSMVPTDGGVTHLFLGHRLMQFPFALIGVALTTAAFPLFAKLFTAGDRKGFKENLAGALRINFFLSIPAAAGLALLARPVISLFFQRGDFTGEGTEATAAALLGYAVGIPFLSALLLLTRAFYAMGRWKQPLVVSACMVAVNILLDLVLVGPFAEAGVAAATSIAAVLQSAVLFILLRNRIGPLGGRTLFRGMLSTVLLTAGLCAVVAWSLWWIGPEQDAENPVVKGVRVFLPLILGMAVYLLPARWICRFELDKLWEALKRRREPLEP
jgi:putative peptidoglycan lipid II flippase